jgi:hypothetical protein
MHEMQTLAVNLRETKTSATTKRKENQLPHRRGEGREAIMAMIGCHSV